MAGIGVENVSIVALLSCDVLCALMMVKERLGSLLPIAVIYYAR